MGRRPATEPSDHLTRFQLKRDKGKLRAQPNFGLGIRPRSSSRHPQRPCDRAWMQSWLHLTVPNPVLVRIESPLIPSYASGGHRSCRNLWRGK
jgi:hypothetical protein